jgi:hypothetical protein
MRLRGTARKAGPAALAAAALLGLAGCGGTSGAASDPTTLLQQAKATVDGAGALHFTLTTSGDHGSTAITGGEGDLGHPDKLRGTFTVSVAGIPASVKVAAGGGTFLAQLPFSSSYTPTDPSSFGIANPAKLISPTGGLSSILIDIQHPRSTGRTRVDGEVLDTVTGTVPGTDLSALPDDDASQPVQATAEIDPSDHQLRRIALTGPIGTTGRATYTVTLTDYGEHVDLSLPSSS